MMTIHRVRARERAGAPARRCVPPGIARAALSGLLGSLALGLGAGAAAAGPAGELAPRGVCPGAESAAAPAASQQAAMRCLIDYARRAHGLSPLRASAQLGRSAGLKSALMLSCRQFAHGACKRPWDQVFTQVRYPGRVRGENIAWAATEAGSPRQVMALWLRSPEHRANILRPGWTDQGLSVRVGVSFQGQARVNVWTSQFGRAGALAAARERPMTSDSGGRRP
jgi:uncharacterized protein YkwD